MGDCPPLGPVRLMEDTMLTGCVSELGLPGEGAVEILVVHLRMRKFSNIVC